MYSSSYPFSDPSPSSSFDPSSLIWPGLIGLVIIIIVFLILRNITLWYWRVNDIVDRLEDISGSLKQIAENTKKE